MELRNDQNGHVWQRQPGLRLGGQQGFYLLMFAYVLVIFATFLDYGVTSDEVYHAQYGRDIFRWYTSFFQDERVFASKDTWLYGGCFDLFVTLVGAVLPLEVFDARHLLNALVGLLGVVAAYRLGAHLGGEGAGVLAGLFLLLTPRYYGHAFFNPKDVPFAVGYLWSVYYLIRVFDVWPHLSRRLIWQTGLCIGLTLGIRIGGALLIGYLFFFVSLKMLQTRAFSTTDVCKAVLQVVPILVIAYATMLVFWPWAQIHPLDGPWQAIQTFSSFPDVHYTFFEGIYIGSDETPWHYVLKWLALTLPEFALLGLLAGNIIWVLRARAYLLRILLVFTAFFPIANAAPDKKTGSTRKKPTVQISHANSTKHSKRWNHKQEVTQPIVEGHP